ncbi:YDG/SRA domain-containing protein [Mycolicibacillus parakoreensis]|uniref:YDG/SRA domain-containing protein n=1 Tax=Mycolicibacillus parakoreensis TaxID=1069221 RepID=UPI0038996011
MADRVYGHIPGNPVGTTYANREAAHRAGVHRPLQGGISGGKDGADSIVVSGGYVDDEDYGDTTSTPAREAAIPTPGSRSPS